MAEYIEKQAAIGEILGQPPEAHYPTWYAMKGNFNRRLKLDYKWPFVPYWKHRPSTVRNNKKLDSRKERRILNRLFKERGDAE